MDIALENFAAAVMSVSGAKVEVVKRIKDEFEVLPRRWVANADFRLAWALSALKQRL